MSCIDCNDGSLPQTIIQIVDNSGCNNPPCLDIVDAACVKHNGPAYTGLGITTGMTLEQVIAQIALKFP